ncbi:anti-sigma factor family protein [Pseudooceanicola algae]|uniref:Putative zinc-finger domain-containing protein n=1 Tax=Pseudooceanicola algae TaxID=1537215 RepID=A0A418SK28_9RHOB|nr:anti-sigma factor [Pseudooceanicola algae]QPM92180.1 hypothetical protein PSAL_034440 [Pseudooceanicola algae]
MRGTEEKLSAFLDGELTEAERLEVEAALARDPALQAELETLMAADAGARDVFDAMLEDPVPLGLADAIRTAPDPSAEPAANRNGPASGWRWGAVAAACLLIGASGGYFTGTSQGVEVASARDWLTDIADYHRVYAAQDRHLVEVPAAEAPHIQTWLTASIGADVAIPDLTSQGLTFQGARLLVAAGRPVSQLIYTDADNRVVALCQIQTDAPRHALLEQRMDAFDMVTWGGNGANFVIIGDAGREDLRAVAEAAQIQV